MTIIKTKSNRGLLPDLNINIAIEQFRKINPFVVMKKGEIVDYADIQPDGYIDHFYCHHKFQREGVGKLLFSVLKKEAEKNDISEMYSNVSITAKPFFEAMGFLVEKEQMLQMKSQQLKNFRMVCKIYKENRCIFKQKNDEISLIS